MCSWNCIQILIKVMNPNTHQWENLSQPYQKSNQFFQSFSTGFGGFEHLMKVASELIDLRLRDADGACSEINEPTNPLNSCSKFWFLPTDGDLGDLAKD